MHGCLLRTLRRMAATAHLTHEKQKKTAVMTAHKIPYSHPAEIIEVYNQMSYKSCERGVGGG